MLLCLASCQTDTLPWNEKAGEIEVGEKLHFTTMVPDVAATTRSAQSEWQEAVDAYKTVNHDYTFSVTMYKQDNVTPQGTSTYKPTQTTNIGSPAIADYDGTLEVEAGADPLFWADNVSKWAFVAEANNNTLSADQSDEAKWLAMDHLRGHSYLPIWTGDAETGSGTDLDAPLYLTSREWYANNKALAEAAGLMQTSADYKKIPLYMRHQRAWITLILKAGEGVAREALKYETSDQNIATKVFSYNAGTTLEIDQSWSSEHLIDYTKDSNGPAQSQVSTTRYDAIVMPYNYAACKDEDVIAKVNLSNQNFSFYASNDIRYVSGTTAQRAEADRAYNLEAGKHLTIVATLSRESRKILITSWIEDWTEVATSTICDDYGHNGDPVVIKNRDQLIAFLRNPKTNCQGSEGIIQPTELNLDAPSDSLNGNWAAEVGGFQLNATLNLAGCTLITAHQLFANMSSSANLVNGTIKVTEGATVKYAVADKNEGTIERVNVTTTEKLTTARATEAGMVGLNHGTIYKCMSTLPVYATTVQTITGADLTTYEGFVGGIAAVSVLKDASSMAVIDGCWVDARVDGVDGIRGGGIVGYATGRISNNTYEYGMTIGQPAASFKNIFATGGAASLSAYGNAWPTSALNPISSDDTNPNAYSGAKYDAVIDCQQELRTLMTNAYNIMNKNYRVSQSFEVASTNDDLTDWPHGRVSADNYGSHINNVSFNLDGNGKTITLTGTKTVTTTTGTGPGDGAATTYTTAPMLFNCILGEVRDLTLYLDKPLVASPSVDISDFYSIEDAIAPLAYAVYGSGRISNVQVKAHNDAYIQSSTPAGLVVWAYGGATVRNCKVKVPVKMWLPEGATSQAKHYAGGIVACAAHATITQCTYLGNDDNALSPSAISTKAHNANNFYGGIVGGTAPKSSDLPLLQITDCTSWFIAKRPTGGDTDKSSKGAIIAYSCYATTGANSQIVTGMDKDNKSEGNWWPLSAVGAHTMAAGLNEDAVIGKRNSVTPTYDTSF